MSIFIFGMSPASVYIVNKFNQQGYKVTHVHSQAGKYSKMEVLQQVCDNLLHNDYDLVFPTIFRNQQWPRLQEIVKTRNCNALLPSAQASRLEGNKLYAKKFLQSLGIPTAKLLDKHPVGKPYVLKSDIDNDGLQTIITTSDTWDTGIIEEYLEGPEYSYHALLNRVGWKYLGSARDYKRIYDNDQGHNTVGMGAYSLKDRIDSIVHSYMDRIYQALKQADIDYVGVIYLGIKVVDGTPYVLEINTRIGDPEIQCIGETVVNFCEMLVAAGKNTQIPEPIYTDAEAVTIKLVNKDYGSLEIIEPVNLNSTDQVTVCKAEDISTTYCSLHATGATKEIAAAKIYAYLKSKDTGGYRYRNDIGILD